MPDASLLSPSVATVPKQYTVTGTQDITLRSVTASFDGTSAAGSFVPALQIVDNTGVTVATFPIGTTLAAGASADVTWFPGLASGTSPPAAITGAFFVTGAGMWPSVTTGSSFPNRFEAATNKQNAYLVDFTNGSQTFAQATIAMPTDYTGGTLTAAFYWMVNGATAGNVVWTAQGRAYANGDTFDQAFGSAVSVTSAATGTANQVIATAASAAMTLAGSPLPNQLVQFRFSRNGASGSDTLATLARLLGVQIVYPI